MFVCLISKSTDNAKINHHDRDIFLKHAEPSLKLLILHFWKRFQCEFVLKHLYGLTLPSTTNQL